MRNANLLSGNPPVILGGLDSLDMRLIAYQSQARTYLLSNAGEIMSKYADLIYERLCEQNPRIKESLYGVFPTESPVARAKAIEIISAHITICEDVLVLFNPDDKEPAVVEDAYMFSDYDIGAFEIKILSEYIENKKKSEDNFEDLFSVGKFVAGKAASGAARSAVAKLGDLAILRADRLATLAKHYDGGHQARMRVQRSFKGKALQKNMMKQIASKGKNLSKLSNFYKKGGSFMKGRGLPSLTSIPKPITLFDALKPETLGYSAYDGAEIRWIEILIPTELAKYCEKSNNYRCIPKYFYE